MSKKRARDSEDPQNHAFSDTERVDESAFPLKRARGIPFPRTPHHERSTASCSTPRGSDFTPYPLRAFDSPTNPFGRTRTQTLTRALPPPSLFRHHLPLRFQFVRKDVPRANDGVYRVVQVPLSYTFTHLRCLVAFLFGMKAALGARRDDDHLFEVKEDVVMFSKYKPGQIKSGKTWAKLSSTQDPCRWKEEGDETDSDDDGDDVSETGSITAEEVENIAWEWKDESEFTLNHAWPNGIELERGILYIHSKSTQVHISLNTTPVPRRKGKGNSPYVFAARGRVHLSPPPPLPGLNLFAPAIASSPKRTKGRAKPPVFARSSSILTSKQNNKKRARSPALDNEEWTEFDQELHDLDENHPFMTRSSGHRVSLSPSPKKKPRILVDSSDGEGPSRAPVHVIVDVDDDDDNEYEDFAHIPDTSQWNEPENKFLAYLREYMGPEPKPKPLLLSDDDDDGLANPPGLTRSTSGESSPARPPTSSPSRLTAPSSSSPTRAPFPSSDRSGRTSRTSTGYSSGYYDYSYGSRSSSPDKSMERSGVDLGLHFPNTKYTKTPAPPRAKVHRMRLSRLERSFEKSKFKVQALEDRDAREARAAALAKAAREEEEEEELGDDDAEGEDEEDELDPDQYDILAGLEDEVAL